MNEFFHILVIYVFPRQQRCEDASKNVTAEQNEKARIQDIFDKKLYERQLDKLKRIGNSMNTNQFQTAENPQKVNLRPTD